MYYRLVYLGVNDVRKDLSPFDELTFYTKTFDLYREDFKILIGVDEDEICKYIKEKIHNTDYCEYFVGEDTRWDYTGFEFKLLADERNF